MKRNLVYKLAAIGMVALFLLCNISIRPDFAGGKSWVQAESKERPKYVLFFIGDGMGQSHRTLATLTRNNVPSTPQNAVLKPLVMDSFPVWGMTTTYSYDQLVTDSSAAGTALAAGVKTDNKSLGQTPDGRRVRTVLEAARDKGQSTGLVTTTRITHATPASFAAHVDHRDKEAEIAAQYVDADVDVLLGGGDSFFQPQSVKGSKRKDDRNLYQEFAAKGYKVLNTVGELRDFNPAATSGVDRVVGVYNSSHLTWEIDRDETQEPSLAEMTGKAISILNKNNKGFFIMVEGGRIDHAAHQHDAVGIINDTMAFDDAVAVAYEFYLKHPKETLIIVAADHETGGLGIGTMNDYFFNPQVINSARATMEKVGQNYNRHRDAQRMWQEFYAATGIGDLTADEVARVEKAMQDTAAGVKAKNGNIEAETLVGSALTEVLNSRAHVGFTSYAHTGTAVPITAVGAGSAEFGRMLDNTDVAKILANLMDVKLQ
ncbi:MAG: alkaline phosphatase [Negativicutes bacterium]|nr:alkaline phosphatase [Negativicutes bacterium]